MRAVVVISAVAVMATGVTYAALQSQQATLTGNSMQTATADLRIGTSASSFAASRTGFAFNNLVPGGAAVPTEGNTFYLKNYGSVPMTLKVTIGATPANTNAVDLTKTYLVFTRVDTNVSQKISVQSLVASEPTGGTVLTDNIDGNAVGQYKVQAIMDEDAFTGTSASVGAMDIIFVGTVVKAQ